MSDNEIKRMLQQRKAYERMKDKVYEAAIIPMLLVTMIIVLMGAY